MQPRRSLVSLGFIGHAIPLACAVLIGITMLLYSRSQVGLPVTFEVGGVGSASLQFQSSEGKLMFGVFEEASRRSWWRPRAPSLADLRMRREDDFGLIAGFTGWGIGVPHLAVMAALMIPIAWWFVVFRHRDEHARRIERGLCMTCGYDLTYSPHRCPECGEAHANLRWNERNDNDAPLPPPPLK